MEGNDIGSRVGSSCLKERVGLHRSLARLEQKSLEVVLDHLVQRGLVGAPALIAGGHANLGRSDGCPQGLTSASVAGIV